MLGQAAALDLVIGVEAGQHDALAVASKSSMYQMQSGCLNPRGETWG